MVSHHALPYRFFATMWFAISFVAAYEYHQLHHLKVAPLAPYVQLPLPSRSERYGNGNRVLNYYDDAFNPIISIMTFHIPDSTIARSGVQLTISDTVCRDLTVKDIQISHDNAATGEISISRIDLKLDGVEISCDFQWEASMSILSSSGSGLVTTEPSSSVSIGFVSPNFTTLPPYDLGVYQCTSDVKIEEVTLEDDNSEWIAGILNLLEDFVRDSIEEVLNEMICDQFGNFHLEEISTLLSGYLTLNGFLNGGTENEPEIDVDPALTKQNTAVPTFQPTANPIHAPSKEPTIVPTAIKEPTTTPTNDPTVHIVKSDSQTLDTSHGYAEASSSSSNYGVSMLIALTVSTSMFFV